jgi:hypothetical protein
MRHSGIAAARRTLLALAAAAGFNALQGCGDGPMPPPAPTLRVSVATTGVDLDPDGYVLQGGNVEWGVAAVASVTVYRVLAPGSYQIRLGGLAANCGFDGPDVVPVTITEGQLSSVSFQVQCTATTGAFQISAPTTGRDYGNASYFVELGGEGITRSASVSPNQAVTMQGLPGGSYDLTFGSRAENCTVMGQNPRTAAISVGTPAYQTTAVAFQVECSATTGEVRLISTTTGEDADPDGYLVWRDGIQVFAPACDPFEYPACYYSYIAAVRLYPNAERLLRETSPGTQIYELRDVAPNCVVDGVHPRPVTVTVGDTVEAVFNVVCSSLP